MQYEVIKGCVIKGKGCSPGEVVELDDRLAKQLMGIGRVAPYEGEPTVDRSVGLETSTEQPRKRRGRPPKPKYDAEEPQADDAG